MHSAFAFSQINLVINPSIEILEDTCISYYNQLSVAYGWDTLRNGGGITPDLFNECYSNPNNYCSVPINWWGNEGYQISRSGNGYAGFIALYGALYSSQVREYIQGTLNNVLINEKEYCVEAYLSLSNFSKYSINSIGFYIDDGQISCPWNLLPNITPQVVNNLQLSDTLNWMKVEGSFMSNGTETYITIGNFFLDSLSNPEIINTTGSISAYYYVDDVSVIPTDLPAFAGNDTIINPVDSVFIGRQPEIGLDDDCIWFVNGTAIDTVAGLWVYPDSTTTYVLVQTICGHVSTDSVTVYVFPVGIDEYASWFRIANVYPNPCNGSITISLSESPNQSSEVLIRVCDVTGSIVETCILQFKNNKANLNMNLPDGMYIISISDNKGNTYHPKKITVIN